MELFPEDFQSSDMLGLLIMERKKCLNLRLYMYIILVLTILPGQQVSLLDNPVVFMETRCTDVIMLLWLDVNDFDVFFKVFNITFLLS